MNGKQLHLWQVSKASQLQYYLVKILQDNAFFTRLKNAKNPVFSTFQSFANFHPVSRWELFISLQHTRTLCRHATLLPQTGVLNRLTNIDAARTQTLLTKRDPLHFDTHYRYNTNASADLCASMLLLHGSSGISDFDGLAPILDLKTQIMGTKTIS